MASPLRVVTDTFSRTENSSQILTKFLITLIPDRTPLYSAMCGVNPQTTTAEKVQRSYKIYLTDNSLYNTSIYGELDTPSSNPLSETQSLSPPTPRTYTQETETNHIQIIMGSYKVTSLKMAQTGQYNLPTTGTNTTSSASMVGEQFMYMMKQMKVDMNYDFIHGDFHAPINSSDAGTTEGIRSVCINRNGTALDMVNAPVSVENINEFTRIMLENGAPMGNIGMHVGSVMYSAIAKAFDASGAVTQPASYNIAGTTIQIINTTAVGGIPLILDRTIPATEILVVDYNQVGIVFQPATQNTLFSIQKDVTAVNSEAGIATAFFGATFGSSNHHGLMYNVTV